MRHALLLLFTAPAVAEWVNPVVTTLELPWFHPPIDWVAANKVGFTGDHPLLDDDSEFQAWLAQNTGRRHKFFDGDDGYVRAPWRLPGGHPDLADYFTFEDEPVDDYLELFFDHPNLMDAFLGGSSMPNGHPLADNLLRNLLPSNHPDVDDLFYNDTRDLPEWHIDLSDILTSSTMEKIEVFVGHPNPQEMYYMGEPLPNIHPSVTALLMPFLPPNHPEDLDEILRNPMEWRMPDFHPSLSQFLYESNTLNNPLLGVEDYITLYFDHPDIYTAYAKKERMPEGHPSADSLLRDVLPSGHPDIDDLFVNHRVLPENHPDISRILLIKPMQRIEVPRGHPHPQKMYDTLERTPKNHPKVLRLLEPYLPPDHPENLDEMLRNPADFPLPGFHPNLASFLRREGTPQGENDSTESSSAVSNHESGSSYDYDSTFVNSLESAWDVPTFSVFSGHPDLSTEYDMGDPVDNHPSIYYMFEKYLPEGHPNIDNMMRQGFVLPSYHPDITMVVEPRSLATSPASLLSYCVASIVLVILLFRNAHKLKRRTMEIPPPPKPLQYNQSIGETTGSSDDPDVDVPVMSSDGSNHSDLIEITQQSFDVAVPSLDHRKHHAIELNQKHHDDALGPQENVREIILAYKEKKNTMLRSNWNKAFGRRIVKSDLSMGEAINCLIYILINITALLASPSYDYAIGLGSLSAGNTLFLVMTATRNSVFTWLIGMTFDQALIYHRFIGRLTVVVSMIHAALHYDQILDKTSEKITVTGLVSLSFGLVIFLTSLNYVRRKLFNVFFWSHFSFIGFIVGMYLHAKGARPFILASVACYGLDKLLGLVWTQLPRKTTSFEKVGERTAHVQFQKTPLMNLLGRYKVGQYVFVNFPELSLHEWHPFSVASAPNDAFVDLYIRALGDHTEKIVEYSEMCAAENKQALIRCDGPYGDLSFNYRRYGNLLLVAGGIGITPIISVLKDIFGEDESSKRNNPRHCVKHVTLIWIMPRVSEASLFLELLNKFHLKSLEDPLAPALTMSIHITREEEKCENPQIVYSKPDFDNVMHQCVDNMSEFSQSILVYACGPGSMINQLWDVTMKKPMKKHDKRIRVDFYHESFEF